jgi:hypothetical protein
MQPENLLLNAEIIRQGYALAYTEFPFGMMEQFRALEREPREAAGGLWASITIDGHAGNDSVERTDAASLCSSSGEHVLSGRLSADSRASIFDSSKCRLFPATCGLLVLLPFSTRHIYRQASHRK